MMRSQAISHKELREPKKQTEFPLTDVQASNKDCRMAMVLAHPGYLRRVAPELKRDWDLFLLAFVDPRFSMEYLKWFGRDRMDHELPFEHLNFELCVAMEFTRDELDLHRIFVKLVLCSLFPTQGSEKDRASLAMLHDQDGFFLMKHIAEFASVPTGKRLALLQKARQRLAINGYHWKDF
jgi:hypothetical protein